MKSSLSMPRVLLGTALAGTFLASCSAGTGSTQASAVSSPARAGGAYFTAQATVPTQSESGRSEAAYAPASGNASQLTLEQAVRAALAWHPSIDESVSRIQQNEAEIDGARAGYYPKVSGGLGTSYRNYSSGRDWQPRINVNATQMIYDFGKVASDVEAKTARTNVSRTDLLLGVDTLARDTANAVIEVQRYQALLGAAREQVRGIQAIANLVSERSGRGAATRSDELQAQARVNSAQSMVHEISGQLDRWQGQLAILTGRSGGVSVAGAVPPWLGSACSLPEPDWSQSPAVMQAEARKAEARAQAKQATAQAYPTLSVQAGAGYDIDDSSTSSSDELELKVGINLSGNLYDGGATAAGRRAAEHAVAAADAAIRNARLSLSSSLSQSRSQVASIQGMLASLTERESLLVQTRDLYRQQYEELGTRTLLDLLNAEQDLHQARFDKINAMHDLRRLGVDCMFNSGRTRELLGLRGMTIRGVTL